VKLMKLAVAVAFAMAFGNAYAFHEGGVAYCDGCHTMHASEGNTTMRRSSLSQISQFNAGPFLLQGTTQSGACLNCHESSKAGSYYVSTTGVTAGLFTNTSKIPAQYTPGGDFSWLKYDYTWVSPRSGSEKGSRHGHSIIAGDFGYTPETGMVGNVGPGGAYPAGSLHCSSCHDPHGQYRRTSTTGGQAAYSKTGSAIFASGSYGEEPAGGYSVGAYRILGGAGYKPMSITDTSLAFVNAPPSAVAPSSYNRSEAVGQTRVAYGAGMSEWCANCHGNIHANTANVAASGANLRHPTGANAKLAGNNAQGFAFDFAANYNGYVKTGDFTGNAASSFLSLVQFELGTDDYTVIAPVALTQSLAGPSASSNVSCMSCHRAHATAFQSMTRWENKSEFLTVDTGAGVQYADQFVDVNEGVEARGKNAAALEAAHNGIKATQFSGWQRSLCNKCHVKD
jgi:hypothetical protein